MKRNTNQINLPEFQQCPAAIAIDIDGTLLNSRSLLSERNSSAIKKCLARRIPVIIATSRPVRSVRRLLGEEITKCCSLVLQNGAIGTGAPPLSGRIKETIPPETARNLVKALLEMEPEIRITIELEGYSFGTNRPREPASLWEVNSATPDMQLSLEEALTGEPTKLAVGGLDRDISHVSNAITRRFNDYFSVVGEAGKTFLNITRKTATKSNTLQRLLESQNIPLDNVVALGDDMPDFDMLSACGIPIAMANAVPEIKAITRYCTASNNDDGAAIVLEKILGIF